MIDIVFPKDNEKEFIRIAEKLNLDGLCFVYDTPKDISSFQKGTKLKLSVGVLCKPEDVKRYTGKYLTLMRAPEDQSRIRSIIEKAKPDILFDLEFSRKNDFIHHRASGLNHVLATLARQKGVKIGIDFSRVIGARREERAVYLGRITQNIQFARKFKFDVVCASFTDNSMNLRAKEDIDSFLRCVGLFNPKKNKYGENFEYE
ncbi:RNase P subunit p30 family protein [Nanoarchaeota archaeon]